MRFFFSFLSHKSEKVVLSHETVTHSVTVLESVTMRHKGGGFIVAEEESADEVGWRDFQPLVSVL